MAAARFGYGAFPGLVRTRLGAARRRGPRRLAHAARRRRRRPARRHARLRLGAREASAPSMASFLRIGGDEVDLGGGRIVWRPGTAGDADGIAFALTAHGGPHLLHVTGWLPGSAPADLSCSELLLDVPGPDAALDGRIFAMALVRFGRVSERRAVISLDGEIEGIEAGSDARTTVAADIICGVERAHEPAFCSACGAGARRGRRRAARVRRRQVGHDAPRLDDVPGLRRGPARAAARLLHGLRRRLRARRHAAPGRRGAARIHLHVPGRAHGVRHQRRLATGRSRSVKRRRPALCAGGQLRIPAADGACVQDRGARERERARMGIRIVPDVVPVQDELAERRHPSAPRRAAASRSRTPRARDRRRRRRPRAGSAHRRATSRPRPAPHRPRCA